MSKVANFEEDLKEAFHTSLQLFPNVVQLKAEQKLVIEKVVQRRDVFAQLPTGFGKSLTFQLLPGICESMRVKGHEFPRNPLVVVVSPLLAIVEDQVKYLRSLGIQASFVGESKEKDREILDGKGTFSLLYGSPESLSGDETFRDMFAKEFYQ